MIKLQMLTKTFRAGYESVTAMDNLELEVKSGEFFTLLGPSGCGKSTLLRCIAGLETPDSGQIVVENTKVFSSTRRINVPPNKRRIGMVFQSYAIWPHMTVFKNVAFPLEVQHKPRVRERVMDALALVELDKLSDRYATRLSGGQQQRIALARAIIAEPDLLLLDEPLSNLDAALREQMRSELRRLQEKIRVTTLYVTHDQAEALSMSDRIAVMQNGEFVEIASSEELYNRPKRVFSAKFIGNANVIDGSYEGQMCDGNKTAVRTAFGVLCSEDAAPSGPLKVFFRPENIRPILEESEVGRECNILRCVVESSQFVGDSRTLRLRVFGEVSEAVVECKAAPESRIMTDDNISIHVDPGDVHILASE